MASCIHHPHRELAWDAVSRPGAAAEGGEEACMMLSMIFFFFEQQATCPSCASRSKSVRQQSVVRCSFMVIYFQGAAGGNGDVRMIPSKPNMAKLTICKRSPVSRSSDLRLLTWLILTVILYSLWSLLYKWGNKDPDQLYYLDQGHLPLSRRSWWIMVQLWNPSVLWALLPQWGSL